MGLFTKEQMSQFINENNLKTAGDIQSALKEMFAETMQNMIEAELDTHLGYTKHDIKNKKTTNSRNGKMPPKTVRTELGDIQLRVPRDRDGEYEPQIVKKHQTDLSGMEQQIISMYAKGMSTRDIQAHYNHLYGVDISPTLVSNITDRIMPQVQQWQNRPLQQVYAVVFMDAIHYKVKQDNAIINKAAYMVIGIDLEGHKDVLGMWIGENESAKFWLGVLNDLKHRGIQDILITCVDNLTGFSEAIAAVYPQTDVQKCIVHQLRNSFKHVSYKDLKAVAAALKPIYKAVNESAAAAALDAFETEWGKKYPHVVRSWRTNWTELTAFFQYPEELRRIIYTTNVIESYNRQLRKVTKGKSIFPTDESLMKMLYLSTMDVLKKWTGKVQGWGQILLQLSIHFGDRITPYIH
jgi:transposase-like protein